MIDRQSTDKRETLVNDVYVTTATVHKFNTEDSMRVKTPEGLGAVGVPDLYDYQ